MEQFSYFEHGRHPVELSRTPYRQINVARCCSAPKRPLMPQVWTNSVWVYWSAEASRPTRGYRRAMRCGYRQRTGLWSALLVLVLTLLSSRALAGNLTTSSNAAETIAPYHARLGRSRPLIAVAGQSLGTETTDYLVPYGVLAQSGAAQVIALGTQAGPIQLMPALKIEPQATLAEFDARFPDGADYVIVPAVHDPSDPALVDWVRAQAHKGAV